MRQRWIFRKGIMKFSSAILNTLALAVSVDTSTFTGEIGTPPYNQEAISVVYHNGTGVTWFEAAGSYTPSFSGLYQYDYDTDIYSVLRDTMLRDQRSLHEVAWFGAIKYEQNDTWVKVDDCSKLAETAHISGTDFNELQCAAMNLTSPSLQLYALNCSLHLPYVATQTFEDECVMEYLGEYTIDFDDVNATPFVHYADYPMHFDVCVGVCLGLSYCIALTYQPDISNECILVYASQPYTLAAAGLILIPYPPAIQSTSYRKQCLKASITHVPDSESSITPISPFSVTQTPTAVPTTSSTSPLTAVPTTSYISTLTAVPTTTSTTTSTSSSPATTQALPTEPSSILTNASTPSATTHSVCVTSPQHGVSYCWCNANTSTFVNMSRDNVLAVARQIESNLTINKRSTSAFVRSHTSAEDNRTASIAIGTVAVSVIVTIFGSIVLIDFVNLHTYLRNRNLVTDIKNNKNKPKVKEKK